MRRKDPVEEGAAHAPFLTQEKGRLRKLPQRQRGRVPARVVRRQQKDEPVLGKGLRVQMLRRDLALNQGKVQPVIRKRLLQMRAVFHAAPHAQLRVLFLKGHQRFRQQDAGQRRGCADAQQAELVPVFQFFSIRSKEPTMCTARA